MPSYSNISPDLNSLTFLCSMYTYRRLRHATRWTRRLSFALLILVLLLLSWRTYRTSQQSRLILPEPPSQLA